MKDLLQLRGGQLKNRLKRNKPTRLSKTPKQCKKENLPLNQRLMKMIKIIHPINRGIVQLQNLSQCRRIKNKWRKLRPTINTNLNRKSKSKRLNQPKKKILRMTTSKKKPRRKDLS